MKIINTNIGQFKLFYNENKLEEIEFNFENQKLKIKKSIIFEKENYEIINILENKLVGFNYYNKKEISNILNLNNEKGMFHLVYDYNEYANNVKEKYKVRYFLVDKKYLNYLDLIKRQKLQGLLREAFFKNMTEDLYKDIDNNLFLIVLNFTRQKLVNKNLIINNNPFDINHFDFFENFKDEEMLIQTICELEENIEKDIEEIFNYFENC
jgi:hypothetical protein